jgi:hypothetical protein
MVSSPEFCASHGVSAMSLSRWRKRGLVRVTPEGTIDAEATDEALRGAGLGRFKRAEPAPVSPESSLSEAQRRKEIALARLRLQKLRQLQGQWLLADVVRKFWPLLVDRIQGTIRELPAEIVAAVEGMQEPRLMFAAVEAATYAAMEKLAATSFMDLAPGGMPPEPVVPDNATKIQAEAIKTTATAQMHELQIAIGRGEMVALSAFSTTLGRVLLALRAHLLALPSKLPLFLAGERDRLRATQAAIEDVLSELPEQAPDQLFHPDEPYPQEEDDAA